MKNIFNNILASAVLCCFGAVACQKPAEPVEEGKYGKSTSVVLPSEKGETQIDIVSDGQWYANLTSSTKEWVRIEGETSGNGSGSVTISFKENSGLMRKGVMLISSESRATIDTVYLKQYGIGPFCELKEDTLEFSSVPSSLSSILDTNIPASGYDKFSVSATYTPALEQGAQEWVSVTIAEDLKNVTFAVLENSAFTPRSAEVTITYTNAWDEKVETSLVIKQGIPGGTETTVVKSFEEIRSLISEAAGEKVIEEDIAMEGVIISDIEGLNMGDCPNTADHTVDMTPNSTTAYIQNQDATLGFRLMTADKASYLMNRYDAAKIWLKGLTIVKEDNPVRYTIKGITEKNYISLKSGSAADIPVKTRYINTLKDEDIYTFVTLKKVEMPCRRGGLLPVNGNYRARFTKYPSLVADIHGDRIYMMTNLPCFDINPKETVPFGQGRISGIIVHESYSRFEKDGNIGRYQIRYCRYEDIAISKSVNDNYSKAIVEWSNEVSDKSKPTDHKVARLHPVDIIGEDIPGINWAVRPSDGWGIAYQEPGGPWPAVSGNFTDPSKMTTTGSSSWGFTPTWDAELGRAHACTFMFSTKDINTTMLTFVMTARYHKPWDVPVDFVLEASADQGKTWTKVRDFEIHPIVDWGSTKQFAQASDKSFYFVLPQELVGLDRAMVRMYCPNNKKCTKEGVDAGTFTGKAGGAFLISYAAVRYKN